MAETENTRRRLTKERDDSARFGASSFAKDMLSVADNLHRAPLAREASEEARAVDFAGALRHLPGVDFFPTGTRT